MKLKSKQDSRLLVITSITIGGSLEWYEVGLFVFWPFLITDETHFEEPIAATVNASAILLIVALALAYGGARSIGGWFFGRKGDREGRNIAFSLSILIASLPAFFLFFLSFFFTYEQWHTYYTAIFTFIKFLQGIPAGGELPGAICYLSEDVLHERKKGTWTKRRYLCSFAMIGPQIGIALSIIVCLILKHFFPIDFLVKTGWRYVFLVSGILGISAFAMRKKLHETMEFLKIRSHHEIVYEPIKILFKKLYKILSLASLISIFEITSFSVLSALPFYYQKKFDVSLEQTMFLNLGFSVLCIIFPPIIGFFSSRYVKFPWLKVSAWLVAFFSFFFYLAFLANNFSLALIINIIMIFLFSIQAALLPSILSELFPVQVRYTGIAFSFNVCDGILWSLITSISFLLISIQKDPNFLIFLPLGAASFLLGAKLLTSKISIDEKLK